MINDHGIGAHFGLKPQTTENNKKSKTYENTIEKEIKGQAFLKQLSDECNAIFEDGFKISEEFASNEFQAVGREAAEALAVVLEKIKENSKPKSITDRAIALLPNVLQKNINGLRQNVTARTIENQSVSKTTKSIFESLEKQNSNLKNQLEFILKMEDNITLMIEKLTSKYNILEQSFDTLLSDGYFKNNRRDEFLYKDLLNNIATHIKSFESQKKDIYLASVACNETLRIIQEQIPHLRQALINSLSTNAFIQSIHDIQTNVNNLIQTTSEISISNSEKNKTVLLEVTDTTKYRENQIKTLARQRQIEKETRDGVTENFQKNMRMIDEHNKLLVHIDQENEKLTKIGVMDKSGETKHKVKDFSKIKQIESK